MALNSLLLSIRTDFIYTSRGACWYYCKSSFGSYWKNSCCSYCECSCCNHCKCSCCNYCECSCCNYCKCSVANIVNVHIANILNVRVEIIVSVHVAIIVRVFLAKMKWMRLLSLWRVKEDTAPTGLLYKMIHLCYWHVERCPTTYVGRVGVTVFIFICQKRFNTYVIRLQNKKEIFNQILDKQIYFFSLIASCLINMSPNLN